MRTDIWTAKHADHSAPEDDAQLLRLITDVAGLSPFGPLDMARLLGPDAPIVRESVDEARETLDRLGARPYAARLEALLDGRASEVGRSARVASPIDA